MIDSDYHNATNEQRRTAMFPGDPVGDYHHFDDAQGRILDYEKRVEGIGLEQGEFVPEAVMATLEAAERLTEIMEPTPLKRATKFSQETGVPVYFKCEDQTDVRSFKIRGAWNRISQLTEEERARGVIAASAGNHAQGVALSAQQLKISATIVMPKNTPPIKIRDVELLGADIVLFGDNYDEAYVRSQELMAESDAVYIHPFDDEEVIAGQGTIAKEILDLQPDATHIFVPIGGGGLISGIAQYAKFINPEIKVIGVQVEGSEAMAESRAAGKRVVLADVSSAASGVAVKEVGEQTYQIVRDLVDDIMVVTEDEMYAAMETYYEDTRGVLEPAGALSIAGARRFAANREVPEGSAFVTICSGANTQFETVGFAAKRTEIGRDREAIFTIALPEEPGSLLALYRSVIAEHNTKDFSYFKSDPDEAEIRVSFTMGDRADKENFMAKLRKHNYAAEDFSHDEFIKNHPYILSTRSERPPQGEALYELRVPERAGALLELLEELYATNSLWSITAFDYHYSGGDIGRVLIGIEDPDIALLETVFSKTTRGYKKVPSFVVDKFLRPKALTGSPK